MAQPILIKDSVLGIAEVVDIIQRRKDYHFTDKPIIHAKGGQVYLFFSENDPVKKDDWRCDNYRWCNSGVTRLPRKDPVLKEHYFYIDLPEGPSKRFQRHAYQLLCNDYVTVLHYIGDETSAQDFFQGNAKNTTPISSYIRTAPSTISCLRSKLSSETPNRVYQEEISSPISSSEYQKVLLPRNSKQVSNLRYKELQCTRISQDSLFNIHEVAYDIKNFV